MSRGKQKKEKNSKPPLADMMTDFNLALTEVSRVTAFGCTKHGRLGGWRDTLDFERTYQNAKARHALCAMVEQIDEESGLYHLAHEAWNALALLQAKMEYLKGKTVKSGGDGVAGYAAAKAAGRNQGLLRGSDPSFPDAGD